ncbi:STAS domain-containing protein [Streptomyces sp. NPDC018029]|uniref:STAS domain-containing protein n=1 Tax=Streptomyces sp. NPDC018029 TaxID=3365032 RepID=UPI00379BEDF8
MRTETVLLEKQCVILLAGEIDLSTVGTLYEAVRACLDAGPTRVLIDLQEVCFCDCVGLRALLQAKEEILRAGACFGIHGPLRPLVARLVERTHTADRLGLAPASPEEPV